MKPRFQFTIRGLLWATFWAAAGMAAWTYLLNRRALIPSAASDLYALLISSIIVIAFLSPFIAVGALFGKAGRGVSIGLVAVILTAVGFFVFLLVSGTASPSR